MNSNLPYKTWRESWLFFENNFENKFVSFEYQIGPEIRIIEISFKKQHFCHLCGIKYKFGANRFVDDLMHKKISPQNIIFNESSSQVFQKATCLDAIRLLLTKNIRVVESGTFLKLQFDSGIRTSKDIFALTCIQQDNGYSVPNSLINLRSPKNHAKVFIKSYPVTSIYYVDKMTRVKKLIF